MVNALRRGLYNCVHQPAGSARCWTYVGQADDEGRHAMQSLQTTPMLRAVGFDDRGILQYTLIASWFNYINRVADALGVGTRRRVRVIDFV